MGKFKLLLFALLPLILFSGCLQVDTKVNLNQDGSGTIEETFLLKNSVVNMMKEFISSFDSSKTEDFSLFNEDELKNKESNFGEGVKYLSGKKIVTDDYEGFKAVYSFKDINKIKINPNPEDKLPLGDKPDSTDQMVLEEFLKFNFKKGNPSTLVIDFFQPQKNEETKFDKEIQEVEDTTLSSTQLQKLAEMFDGMKISLALNFDHSILETNASFVDGSEITLISIDFSELIKHKEILEELQKSKPESLEELKEILGDLPGIKIETKEKVTVKF